MRIDFNIEGIFGTRIVMLTCYVNPLILSKNIPDQVRNSLDYNLSMLGDYKDINVGLYPKSLI